MSVAMRGCLYRSQSERRNTLSKQVSFPEDDGRLVTGFMEAPNPWEYAGDVSRDNIIQAYTDSCLKHGHRPSANVLDQLEVVELNGDRSSCLNLKNTFLDASSCESLEEILKRVQFTTLCLENTALDDEAAVAVFDMIEYYESASHLIIASNPGIAVRGWQACARLMKKTQCLDQFEARNMILNEQIMPILSRSLRITTHLQILKLENCKLSGRPIIILVGALKMNSGLRELYLADNDLGITDALQLAALLRSNTALQLLDVSNNNIQDGGTSHIVDGLIEQPISGDGLSILVLWNNRLTRNSSPHFARALSRCRSLEMLNIGHNVLSSEVLHTIKDPLQQNRTLLRLGMQSTNLSCEGAIALAEVIEDNHVIQRIDLRDNAILVAGLKALALCMKSNHSVTQLDLDDVPKKKSPDVSLNDYQRLVSEIRDYCSRNEQLSQTEVEEEEDNVSEVSDSERPDRRIRLSSINSRKISLTCQTLLRSVVQDNGSVITGGLLVEPRRSGGRLRSPAPSPVPSPVSSPMPSPAPSPGPARNRFRVSQVSESDSLSSSPGASPSSSPTCFFPTSRFKVTVVEPPSPVVASNTVTLGFSYSDKGAVSPDTDNEVRSIMSAAQSPSTAPVTTLSQAPVQKQPQQQLQPQAQPETQSRSRKISWVQMGISSVSSISSDDGKVPSSLERLLGLFQNPGSFFNKSPSPQPSCVPRKSPQSSPQLQRAAPPQNPENGVLQPKNCPSGSSVLHPVISSTQCPNEHSVGSNIGTCGFLRVGMMGHDGDTRAVEPRHQDRRDVINNNQGCDVVQEATKESCADERDPSHKDENLNVNKAGGLSETNHGGGDDTTAVTQATSVATTGLNWPPCSAPSCASSEDSSNIAAEAQGTFPVTLSAPATDSLES